VERGGKGIGMRGSGKNEEKRVYNMATLGTIKKIHVSSKT